MDSGHRFVTMDGTIVTLRLCVDNLGLVQQEVSTHTVYIYMYTVSTCKELRPIYTMQFGCMLSACINHNVCITNLHSRTLHMMCRIG